jgi:hypothetical protein
MTVQANLSFIYLWNQWIGIMKERRLPGLPDFLGAMYQKRGKIYQTTTKLPNANKFSQWS